MIVAGVIMAVGALAQLYNSEKARGASAERLKEIERLYDKIKPPNYDLRVMDPPALHAQAMTRPEFSDPATAPRFDQTRLAPEDMKLIGKYVPQVAPYIAEEAPHLVERTAEGKQARTAQMKALERLMQVSESGTDPAFEAQQESAARRAQTEAQSRQASILQDFARRGQGGSGLNLAAQLGGSADSMDREAMAGQQGAADAYRQRMQALSQGASLAGDIGRDDESLQSRNAGIINDFNERTSRSRQAWEQQRAGALSDASRYNLGVEQGLSNQNTQARNAASVRERDRGDDLTRYDADFARRERDRQDELGKWNYGADVAQRNYGNDIAMQMANWNKGERNNYNSLQGQTYNDQLQKAGLQSGTIKALSDSATQRAQDQNAAIGGLSSAYAGFAAGQDAKDTADDREDKKWDRYYKDRYQDAEG